MLPRSLIKGHYPEDSQVVFRPDKQRYLEPFMCSDLASGKIVRKRRGLSSVWSFHTMVYFQQRPAAVVIDVLLYSTSNTNGHG